MSQSAGTSRRSGRRHRRRLRRAADGGDAGALRAHGRAGRARAVQAVGAARRAHADRRGWSRRAGGRRRGRGQPLLHRVGRRGGGGRRRSCSCASPTPQSDDGSADLSFVEAAAKEIASHLEPGAIVVNKSTVPVGSANMVEQVIGRADIGVVSNPEFLREGTAVLDSLNPDRIVVGADDAAGRRPGRGAVRLDRRAAHRDRRHDLGDDQVRVQRVPGHQAELRQRPRRPVRGGGRRRPRRPPRPGLRQAHRFRVPPARPGLGRLLPAQGHPGAASHRRGGGLRLLPAGRSASPPTTSSCPGWWPRSRRPAAARPTGRRSASWGLTFKANTDDRRDSPSLQIARRLAAWGPRSGPSTRRSTPRPTSPTLRPAPARPTPTRPRPGPGSWWCSPSGTSSAGSTSPACSQAMAEPNIVDARNLLDPAAVRRLGFRYTGIGRQ